MSNPDVTFSGNGRLPDTLEVLISMLAGSPKADKGLLLAYGYTGCPKGMQEAVSKWLDGDRERRVTLLMGLLPERKVDQYRTGTEGEKTYEPYIEDRIDVEALIRNTSYLFSKTITGMKFLEEQRIRVLAVTGYHGKACVLLDEIPMLSASVNEFKWNPREAIIGSSNLTENAMFNNFELDVQLHRDTNGIAEFSTATRGYFWELFDRTDHECKVSTSVTASLQTWLDGAVQTEIKARCARAQKEMDSESQRLLDADN